MCGHNSQPDPHYDVGKKTVSLALKLVSLAIKLGMASGYKFRQIYNKTGAYPGGDYFESPEVVVVVEVAVGRRKSSVVLCVRSRGDA